MQNKKIEIRTLAQYLALISLFVLVVLNFDKAIALVLRAVDILFPLILGAVFAYILNIVMRGLERVYFPRSKKSIVCKTRRPVCIVLSFLLILGILALVMTMIVPELVGAVSIIAQGVSIAFEQVKELILGHAEQFPTIAEKLQEFQVDWQSTIKNIANIAIGGVGDILSVTVSVITTLVGGVVNIAIAAIFAVYILANKEKLRRGLRRLMTAYLRPQTAGLLRRVGMTANQSFTSFIVGQCTEAVILGVLCMAGMWIFRFPYAPMIGAFVGVTALIPIVGAYLGAGVGAIMILTVDPIRALWFIVFIVVLQQLEGNLIYPRVVGSSIGLPGMWVLAAVTLGGGLGGILGMLVGVPAAATLYKLLRADVNRRVPQRAGAKPPAADTAAPAQPPEGCTETKEQQGTKGQK